MGLDMYLTGEKYFVQDFGRKVPDAAQIDENEGRPVDADGEPIESARYRMGSWRKHAPLHTYIIQQFADGQDDCRDIALGSSDLIRIADAIERDQLPPDDQCEGFFFGSPEIWDQHRADKEHAAAIFRSAAGWIEAAPKYESGHSTQWRSVCYQASW